LLADVVIINKVKSAEPENVCKIVENVKKVNPNAKIIKARTSIQIDKPEVIKRKSVLVVEDGPTLTHGGLAYGAGAVAAKNLKAKLIDPRKYAVGSIKKAYETYRHLGPVVPALGYTSQQIQELERTINSVPCDAIVLATPVDLNRFMQISKPVARVSYEIEEIGKPDLTTVLKKFVKKL
jgi:predicted GTPase